MNLPQTLKKRASFETIIANLHVSFETIVAVVLVVAAILAVVAVIWVRRRRRKAAAAAAATSEPRSTPAAPPAPDTTAGDEIARTWRRFVRGLPGRARRSLDHFHPVVMLGTESASKPQIIQRFSGVSSRRAQIGAPAQLTDGDLRLHLGGEILVMELSEEACRARMDTVGGGLRRAFGPALRRKTPIVVVCLSPESLEKRSEQELRELGGDLYAKIALLADLRGEPLEVRVVIPAASNATTRLQALFLLAQLPGVSPVLPLGMGEEPALRAQLLAYTDLLTEVLTRGADDALEVVELLEAVPQLSQSLSAFASELFDGGADGRVRSGGLYLVPEAGGPNPLEIPAALARPEPHPLVKHRLISLTAATAALVWLAFGYAYQSDEWTTASNAADRYAIASAGEGVLRQQIADYAQPALAPSVRDLFFPDFFRDGREAVRRAFVGRIRGWLVNLVSQQAWGKAIPSLAGDDDHCRVDTTDTTSAIPPEEILYELALLYASSENELHDIIKQDPNEWGAGPLTVAVITNYLAMATQNNDLAIIQQLSSCGYNWRDLDTPELQQFISSLDSSHLSAPSATLVQHATALRTMLIRRPFANAIYVLESLLREAGRKSHSISLFTEYHSRFDSLRMVSQHRRDLWHVIRAVLGALDDSNQRAPADLPSLVDRLSSVVDGEHRDTTMRFELGSHIYTVDLEAFNKAVRSDKMHAIAAAFADQPSRNELAFIGFPEEDENAQEPLHGQWTDGLSGCDALPRPYTRPSFEKWVKPQLFALDGLLARMDDVGSERDSIERTVGNVVENYAEQYEEALDNCYDQFHVAPLPTVTAIQRVFRTLSSDRSPLREFLDNIGQDSTLDSDSKDKGDKASDQFSLLAPLRAVQAKYEPVAKLSTPGGDLDGYFDILRDVMSRLDSAAPPPAQAPAFVANLSPLARLAFESLTDPTKAPLEAARLWTEGRRLDDDMARPFLEPLQRVSAQAMEELVRAVGALNDNLVSGLEAELLSRFPFNPHASEDIDPSVLDDWLNPKHGRVMRDFVAGLGSLIQQVPRYDGRRVWDSSAACKNSTACARGLQPLVDTLNGLTRVTALLWTEDGKTRPLDVHVMPHPLYASGRGDAPPVAVHLVAGDTHLDYFNQKPADTLLQLDWTKPQGARLSVELASTDQIKSFEPPMLDVNGTSWSFLRLLQMGTSQGTNVTWHIPIDAGNAVSVSWTVREDATEAFHVPASRSRRPGWARN